MHLIGAALLALLGAGAAYVLFNYFVMLWKFRHVRGEFPLPILGNCYTSESVMLFRYLVNMRKRYGYIFKYVTPNIGYIVVCDPLVVRRILSDSKIFIKGRDYTDAIGGAFGNGLITSNGEKHRHDRAIFGKYFIRSNIAKVTPMMNSLIDEAIAALIAKGERTGPMNVEPFMASVALRVFMSFAVGWCYKDDLKREEQVCREVSVGSFLVSRIISLGLPFWDCIPWVRAVKDTTRHMTADLDNIKLKRLEQMRENKAPEVEDCLAAMIKENLTDQDMRDHYMTLVCAGHDTTAYFSSYACYLLAQHPKVQETLVQEIATTLRGKDAITVDDLAEMKYLSKFMQETMRLYSIVPVITRGTAEDVYLKEANLTIYKGTGIMIPLFLINRDPEIWENPGVFNPDRFETRTNEWTSAKNGFFPFGYGSRTCIGNSFSQIESSIIVCKMLRKFYMEPDPGFKVQIMAGISLTTSNGINVILKQRPEPIA